MLECLTAHVHEHSKFHSVVSNCLSVERNTSLLGICTICHVLLIFNSLNTLPLFSIIKDPSLTPFLSQQGQDKTRLTQNFLMKRLFKVGSKIIGKIRD